MPMVASRVGPQRQREVNESVQQSSGADRDQPVLSACIRRAVAAGPGSSPVSLGEMKRTRIYKRRFVLILAVTTVVLVSCYWAFLEPEGVGKSLQIMQVAPGTNQAAHKVVFVLTNAGPLHVHPEMVFLEAKTYRGWITFGQTEPEDRRALRAGQARQFAISVPPALGGQRWRLRVTYRYFLREPWLWLGQVATAVRSRPSGRIMAPGIVGVEPLVSPSSYSVISTERTM
jgi:hypothetical protein